jgi:hypothetical protein
MKLSGSSNHWHVGMNAWIIQDGNYPDLEVGQTAEFAIEFWIPDGAACIIASDEAVSAIHGAGCLYNAVADVLLRTDDITVLDIGILIYGQTALLPAAVSQKSRLSVQIGLSVDPFFYLEGLNTIPAVPPLVYSWRMSSILMQTAPFIEKIVEGRKVQVRDPKRFEYQEILRTDAWEDDGGYGEYIFALDLLPIEPKRSSATAIL